VQPLSERCSAFDVTRGRCQLIDGHSAPHAMAVPDAYMTWDDDNDAQHWTQDAPPSWLIDLTWLPGFQPAIRPRDSLHGVQDETRT
jgi:hypothetical protein